MSKRNENAEMQLKIRAEVTENVNPINGQGNNNEKGRHENDSSCQVADRRSDQEVNQTSNAPLMQVCQMTTTRAMVETPRPVACYQGRGGLSPGVGDIGGRCEWSKSTNHSDSRTAREKVKSCAGKKEEEREEN